METSWETDVKIVSAAGSAFAAAVRCSLHVGNLKQGSVDYLRNVEALVRDFGLVPEGMGAAAATIWQDHALALANPKAAVDRPMALLLDAAVQVAAIVFQVARAHGGERQHRQFGFATVFVRATVSERGPKVDFDVETCVLNPRDMLEFVFLRASELGATTEELAGKKERRGL